MCADRIKQLFCVDRSKVHIKRTGKENSVYFVDKSDHKKVTLYSHYVHDCTEKC